VDEGPVIQRDCEILVWTVNVGITRTSIDVTCIERECLVQTILDRTLMPTPDEVLIPN